jgi:glycosyltransferase involved in cell wall biosynthesis
VSLTLQTGGLERLLADFARHHDRDRFELQFLAVSQRGRFAEEIEAAGCVVHGLTSGGRGGRVMEMARLFREHDFDAVHTHNTYPHVYATVAARWAGVPRVINTRHGQRCGHGRKSRWLFRAASRWADHIVSVSDDAARLCVETDGVRADKVSRIWNGIDTDRFEFTGPASDAIAITVSRLSKEKDCDTLLRAVAIAGDRLPDLRLRIVGGGAQSHVLRQLAARLEIADRVEFLGDRNDIPDLLANAGLYVSASLTEGISLTLLEALAVGLPVVATDVGGNREIVGDGAFGRLVPPRSPQRLADAIVEMCETRNRWVEWGREGRSRVERCFDVRRTIEQYERLYSSLCATP